MQAAAKLQDIIDTFTPDGQDANSIIQGVLVFASERVKVERNMIPDVFTPITGKWKIKRELPG